MKATDRAPRAECGRCRLPRRASTLLAALALLSGALYAAGDAAPRGEWTGAVGDPAPQLALADLDGDEVSLGALEGRAVLVNLWATYCLPCRHEMPLLDDLADARREEGLVLLGISLDGPGMEERVKALRDELDLGYPVLLDPEGAASRLFEAPALPASYLFDREGILVWKRLGVITEDDPELERALEKALREPGPVVGR